MLGIAPPTNKVVDTDTMTTIPSIVTIQDVAAHAGVSAMTVSRVINKHQSVASTTRKRVEKAIQELGYVPNTLARSLLHGRTRTIALIVGDISNPFFTQIARGVEDVAQRNGYAVMIGNSDESTAKERRYVDAMVGNRIDGLLIAPAGIDTGQTLKFLSRRGTKFVLIDRDFEGMHADIVMGDSVGGARMLTEHLVGLGHRRIAMITGPLDLSTSRDRLRGYEDVLKQHGIAIDPTLVMESSYKREGGRQAAQRILQLPIEQRPTAVLASNNFLGVGLVETLREAAINVPRDMAVVCFDDIELASALTPFLTVVA
ncbi:MAG: Transcriptional regulator, LacI family, partial [uncultured Chloroflexia bacterium]